MRTELAIMMASLLLGCGSALPTYRPMEPQDAWGIVSERTLTIHAVSAEADVTLTGADGPSMRVDAALVLARPDRSRFRAWKVGYAVLDVTGDAGAIWFDAPDVSADRASGEDLGVAPAYLARGLLLIPGWAYAGVQPIHAERQLGRYLFELPSPDGLVTCEVSVRTLVVLRWQMTNADADTYTVELRKHCLVDGIPLAYDVVLRADDRSVRIRLRNVDLTSPPDPGVFTPPAGAVRMR